jgi:hypothetical protein
MVDRENPKVLLQPERLIQTFAALIAGYDQIANLRGQAEPKEMQHVTTKLKAWLDGFHEARSAWEKNQVTLADDFNLLQVMEVADDEATHSKILAWLLDRRLEHGTHAQGNLGFRLFLQELGPKLGLKSTLPYPNETYWVRCEVSGSESRVDIEIAARGKFIIHIENKISSFEGEDQTHREWRDLEMRAKELGVPRSNIHGIFLTLDRSEPANKNFLAVSWQQLVTVLDRFAMQAQAGEVKLFAAHYADAVRKLTLTESETEENQNEDPAV